MTDESTLATQPAREAQEPVADGRTISGEICMGMPVAAYMADSRHGPQFNSQFATHWSTIPEHEKPERLFRESDVRGRLATPPDAAAEIERLLRRCLSVIDEREIALCELAALKAETDARVKAAVEAERLRELICWARDALVEINVSNYDHDDVCRLNAASVEVILGLSKIADGERGKAHHDVLAERRRQIEAEGWTPEHDDQHRRGELADAAALYASIQVRHISGMSVWPWAPEWFKPTSGAIPGAHRRDVVKACALLLAEIERLDRARAAQADLGQEVWL